MRYKQDEKRFYVGRLPLSFLQVHRFVFISSPIRRRCSIGSSGWMDIATSLLSHSTLGTRDLSRLVLGFVGAHSKIDRHCYTYKALKAMGRVFVIMPSKWNTVLRCPPPPTLFFSSLCADATALARVTLCNSIRLVLHQMNERHLSNGHCHQLTVVPYALNEEAQPSGSRIHESAREDEHETL